LAGKYTFTVLLLCRQDFFLNVILLKLLKFTFYRQAVLISLPLNILVSCFLIEILSFINGDIINYRFDIRSSLMDFRICLCPKSVFANTSSLKV
jgi:hypothetical protein